MTFAVGLRNGREDWTVVHDANLADRHLVIGGDAPREAAMTPRGGPGFLVLQGPDQDYMQTAGGDGIYLAEWREHESGVFRHCVAGRHGAVAPGTVKIPTGADNGNHVVAHRNEVLSADEVKGLARAFLAGEPPPDAFAWRDISAMFG